MPASQPIRSTTYGSRRLALSLGVATLATAMLAQAAGAATPKTKRVSVDANGAQANADSFAPAISGNGRYVAFESAASNLVGLDTNGLVDVFVFDRHTKSIGRANLTHAGSNERFQARNGPSGNPAISADGRFVAFESTASDLVANDTNGDVDILVRDRQTNDTVRVSVRSNGAQAVNGSSVRPSISADGRFVAFQSDATNLVANDTNGAFDIFVHDRQSKKTKRVSVRSSGAQAIAGGSQGSSAPSISPDGRYVAFHSDATNLVAHDTNGRVDVFVHDRWTHKTRRVSIRSGGAQAKGGASTWPSISWKGRYIAFASQARNLVTRDTNSLSDIFVRDRSRSKTKRVVRSNGRQAKGGHSSNPSISSNGRYVAFYSSATNLVPHDTNGKADIFIHDRKTKKTRRVSRRTGGAQATGGDSFAPTLSATGRHAAFRSAATNLVGNDTNNHIDVFVRAPLH